MSPRAHRWCFYIAAFALVMMSVTSFSQEVFVADANGFAGHIYSYSLDGTRTTVASDLYNPGALAVNTNGDLYANVNSSVLIFTADGSRRWLAANIGLAFAMWFDAAGNLFVGCPNIPRGYPYYIAELAPDGTLIGTQTVGGVARATQTADSEGNVYTLGAGVVYKTDTNGTQTVFASGLNSPVGIAFNPVPWPPNMPPLMILPANVSPTVGETVHFQASGTVASPTNYLQWWFNGTPIAGATNTDLIVGPVQFSDSGTYKLTGLYAEATATLKAVATAGNHFLSVTSSGPGTVSAQYTGRSVPAGSQWTFTATPARNCTFVNWTGSITSSNRLLLITMTNDISVQANFVTNYFPDAAGTYEGLGPDTTDLSPNGPFFLTRLNLQKTGAYTASVQVYNTTTPFSGKFDQDLQTSTDIRGVGNISLQMLPQYSSFVGTLSNSDWQASIILVKVGTEHGPSPKYTLLLSNVYDPDSPILGVGTVTESANGWAQYNVQLSDKTVVTGSAPIGDGAIPIYRPLYGIRGGGLFGHVRLNPYLGDLMLWAHPAPPRPSSTFTGFTNNVWALPYTYTAPARGERFVNMPTPTLILSGADLPSPVTNNLVLTTANTFQISATPLKQLQVRANAATGQFTGTFLHPTTSARCTISGVVRQDANVGYGFFTTSGGYGQVYLTDSSQ